VILVTAILVSLLRWLIFPVSDYPDATYVYSRLFSNHLFSGADYSLESGFEVPPNQILSLVGGSMYDSAFSLPSLRYLFVSSLPLLVFAIFAQIYLAIFSKRIAKATLRKSLILFLICPSTAYYLCTIHPEVWATVVALGYVVSILNWASRKVDFSRSLNTDQAFDQPPILNLLLFSLLLIASFYALGDYQSVLCLICILCLYGSLRFKTVFIFQYPRHLVATFVLMLRARSTSLKKLINSSAFVVFFAVLSTLIYSLRAAIVSLGSADSRVVSAVSLYTEGSSFADKYPLFLRPMLTVNNLFVYTPSGFGPSLVLKAACLWPILTSWFQVLTSDYDERSESNSVMSSAMASSLLYPLIFIFLLPGYVNLKYYLFLVPVVLFWPAMLRFKLLRNLFVILWLELGFRSILRFI